MLIKPDRAQKRRQNSYLRGFLLVSFVKLVLNTYPSLHDLSTLAFVLLMNITFVKRQVEALIFICAGILYGVINTWLLSITWLHRFSGNANFLFFQIIALDAFIVIMFVQIYMGVDSQRKKYAEELLRKEDKKAVRKKLLVRPDREPTSEKTAAEILEEPIGSE